VDRRLGSSYDYTSFFLHYKSCRGAALKVMMQSMVTSVAKTYYSKVLSMTLLDTQGVNDAEATVWHVEEISDIIDDIDLSIVDHGDDKPEEELKCTSSCPFSQRASSSEASEGQRIEGGGEGLVVESTALLIQEFMNCDDEGYSLSYHSGGSVGIGSELRERSSSHESDTKERPAIARKKRGYGLSHAQMMHMFPYHIVFDSNLRIIQFGPSMKHFAASIKKGAFMGDLFRICTPHCSWDKSWDALEAVLLSREQFEVESLEKTSKGGNRMHLSGPVSFSDDGQYATFLCTPLIKNLAEMYDHGLSLTDLASRVDIVFQEEHLMTALETNRRLVQLKEEVQQEREKSVHLMQEIADRAQEALALKKTFVRYVSHEIRTPLTVAKLGLMLIRKGVDAVRSQVRDVVPSLMAEIDDTITNIGDCEQSVDVAVTILNDLLSYEKLESGIYELFQDMCPGVSFVEECVSMFAAQVQSKLIFSTFSHLNIVYSSFNSGDTQEYQS
jgi:hypothetical protein